MSYRKVMIASPALISTKDEQLVINTDSDHHIPIEDIDILLIEQHGGKISIPAISKLMQNGSSVIFCDEKHLPCGVLLPFAQHNKPLSVLNDQLKMTEPCKKRIWQKIVIAKIYNQGNCLSLCKMQEKADYLYSLIKKVLSGDTSNVEATAAAFYFRSLFGKTFCRGDSANCINAALNYGYAILRSYIARTLCTYGFTPYIGIHHHNYLNQYNLADDLIEPFRPIVDLYVKQNISVDDSMNTEMKSSLLNLLNHEIVMNGQRQSISYAIEIVIKKLTRCFSNNESIIEFPELIELKMHRYE